MVVSVSFDLCDFAPSGKHPSCDMTGNCRTINVLYMCILAQCRVRFTLHVWTRYIILIINWSIFAVATLLVASEAPPTSISTPIIYELVGINQKPVNAIELESNAAYSVAR